MVKKIYNKDYVMQMLREALNTQMCHCDICNGPATRELQNEEKSLFCDEHGEEGIYKDLSAPFCIVNADWVRKTIALLKEYDKK